MASEVSVEVLLLAMHVYTALQPRAKLLSIVFAQPDIWWRRNWREVGRDSRQKGTSVFVNGDTETFEFTPASERRISTSERLRSCDSRDVPFTQTLILALLRQIVPSRRRHETIKRFHIRTFYTEQWGEIKAHNYSSKYVRGCRYRIWINFLTNQNWACTSAVVLI